jgi:hypothetical protein
MSGKRSTGKFSVAKTPKAIRIMAKTPAKIGR